MRIDLDKAVPDISTRDYNSLVRNGITTFEKLADMTNDDIARLKNVNVKSIIVVRDKARVYMKGAEENEIN